MPRGLPGVVAIVHYTCRSCGEAFVRPSGRVRVYCSVACKNTAARVAPLPRLLSRIAVHPNGCWLWTGCRSNGYGQIGMDGRMMLAHRLAYELIIGPIPTGLHIDHLCRTPLCVNPAHLEPVTPAENIRRGDNAAAQRARWERRESKKMENVACQS